MGFLDYSAWFGPGVRAVFSNNQAVDGLKPDFSLSKNPQAAFNQLASHLDTAIEDCILLKQVHGRRIHRVDCQSSPRGLTPFATGDGLITRAEGLTLVTFHGDCTPIFLYDPEHRAIGLVHSGWKGTAERAVVAAVTAMASQFGSRASAMKALIGPAAGSCCYEVDGPVKRALAGLPTEGVMIPRDDHHWMLDLKGLNEQLLLSAGLRREAIASSKSCTLCDPQFYSHRRAPGEGLMVAAFQLVAGFVPSKSPDGK